MMLPEHKEAIIHESRVAKIRARPVLDDQELEIIRGAIVESYHCGTAVSWRLYDEYEDLRLAGVVERVQAGRIRIDGEWFDVGRIAGVDNES